MQIPQRPPSLAALIREAALAERGMQIFSAPQETDGSRAYLHWDDLRRRKAPEGLTQREWWLGLKLGRMSGLKEIGLTDKTGAAFKFHVPETVQEQLHNLDLRAGGSIDVPEPITNPHTKDRYLVRSLVEEAITSSQLEGAVTTREVAKEMIRTGRRPRDAGERMILNNYATMQRIHSLKSEPLSPECILEIHRLVTVGTLEDASASGRFRRPEEKVVIGDEYGEIFHDPPPAVELKARVEEMCAFANAENSDYFIHPVVRAIILHFWLAYDHPFVDGNGRTARALFYWAMLRYGYWLFEFVSISTIINKAPAQYGRSFLLTETDDNDLTYFLIAQARVIQRALSNLHDYIEKKGKELQNLEAHIRALDQFNHRQVALVRHALKHPGQQYTFSSHQKSHGIAYQTARTDLIELGERGILKARKKGRRMVFGAPHDLGDRLKDLEVK